MLAHRPGMTANRYFCVFVSVQSDEAGAALNRTLLPTLTCRTWRGPWPG